MTTQIPITEDDKKLAKEWSDFSYNFKSIRKDSEKNIVANLGEMIFQRQHPGAKRISDSDRFADFEMGSQRIDVKTKERTVFVKDDYEVSVAAYQKDFNVDYYVFYSYNNQASVMEYLGWMKKDEYYEKAKLMKKGDIDKRNNWRISIDCYNVPISELHKK
jgi:hypothetical protein